MVATTAADTLAELAGDLLDRLHQAPTDRDGWTALVTSCQGVPNVVTALQDQAVVELARRESVWDEDGTLGEVEHLVGTVALDAADLLAPLVGASHGQAQRRVETAVRICGGRQPAEVDDGVRGAATGLRGLHAAMLEGRLDGHRASVVAEELAEAPAEVAAAVVDALDPLLADSDAPALRRRCRRLLARISPDLLRQRAVRARSRCGLRRWVAEPGVDTWLGTFPSEDAAAAWTAVDRLAHTYVGDGTCATVEQARGKALTDLVLQHSSVDVRVVLTTPVDGVEGASSTRPAAAEGPGRDDDLVQVHGSRPSEPVLVPRAWVREHLDPTSGPLPCHSVSGARLDPESRFASDGYRPGARLAALVRARDGRCRFPGCAVAARFCDLDHVRPWPLGPTAAANLLCLCRRHHRLKQSPGWRLRLAPDGTATWTDPTGRVRTTAALDALESVVLPAADAARFPPRGPEPPPPWSALESRLTVLAEHARPCRLEVHGREHHGRRHRSRWPERPPF